jgi:aminoglycoside/choline kinase family phosphotransferase
VSDRTQQARQFLSTTSWSGADILPLAGDASSRRYERLRLPDGQTAVLMDAPPEKEKKTPRFVAIAKHLSGIGLSPPDIYAEDLANGFLLLEDLGDNRFAEVIKENSALEKTLYLAALNALICLHKNPLPPMTEAYDLKLMSEMAALAYSWYKAGIEGTPNKVARLAELEPYLAKLTPCPPVLILRDFHAENLIWLPKRSGEKRVGLLDFQDALSGHPAYDVISLTTDARRDVSPETGEMLIDLYAETSGMDPVALRRDAAILSVQRNLRILGVFARLSLHYGKPGYINLIPRVWKYLDTALSHPDLKKLRQQLLADLPEPTDAALNELRTKCGTFPTAL